MRRQMYQYLLGKVSTIGAKGADDGKEAMYQYLLGKVSTKEKL